MLLNANLKNQKEDKAVDDDDDSDWESVEEDAPVVKLEELLANMQIQDDKEDDGDEDWEDDDSDGDADDKKAPKKNKKEEKKK